MNEQHGALRLLNVIAAVLEKIINFFACILLSVVAVAVVVQVLGRNFNIPVVWLGELSTFAVIWAIFLGLAIGYRNGLFAQVDIICHVTPAGWRKYLVIVWDIISLVLITWILWSSRDYIAHVMRRKMLSPELRFPLWAVYMGPILGYVFTAYFVLVNILNNARALIRGEEPQKRTNELDEKAAREMAAELGRDLSGVPAGPEGGK